MKILIDLSILRHPYCGLGQVAYGYGQWYASPYAQIPQGVEVTLLVPRQWVGRFGDRVRYLVARDIYRWWPGLLPHFDVWHSIHQLSPFRPTLRSTRRILTIHDVNFIYEKQGAKRSRYLRRLQHECDGAAMLCFISQFAHDDAAQWLDLGSRPTQVIYNGVANLTEGEQKRPSEVEEGGGFLLSIGVVKAKKNLHTLLPMMDRLPNHRLVIAGDDGGSYAHDLRLQLSHHPNVRLIGKVDECERRWLYAYCEGLLFPSIAEGFGLPVIEAMQWGKPVFCAKRTSLPEIGAEYAYYFNDFQPENMAAIVANGLEIFDAERASAEQAWAATFGYERHMAQYWQLYCKGSSSGEVDLSAASLL